MISVAVRDLRNNTADVIKKVREGHVVVLTSRGEKIAQITAIDHPRRKFLTPQEVMGIPQTDPRLRTDLAALGNDDTDTLGPIQ
ncbi:MAG: type II toxin-antitoxin system prevent-host-death family antitoxin [Propionibacteriaceae bacterium]|nr:type II toxin-antitoxin system prevent-host-death family antitoxin [Propionibacteriaceae bacterium]